MSTSLWPPDAKYRQKADTLIVVCAERAVICIVAVGGDEYILRRCGMSHGHHHRRMPEIRSVERQLDQIAGVQIRQFAGAGSRPCGLLFPCQKIVKIRHTGPGRGLLVGVNIIPAEGRRKIHDAASYVNALGGKVGTVAPKIFVVIKGGVPALGPTVSIQYGGPPVIERKVHRRTPPFLSSLCGSLKSVRGYPRTLSFIHLMTISAVLFVIRVQQGSSHTQSAAQSFRPKVSKYRPSSFAAFSAAS